MRSNNSFSMGRVCGALALGALVLAGCANSPEQREARSLQRGKKFLQDKNYNRALIEFKAAAQAVRTDAEPYYELGVVSLATGDDTTAYEMLTKATQLNPKHAAAQARLAELIAEKGSGRLLAAGKKNADAALQLAPGDPGVLNALALLEVRSGDQREAQKYLDEALAKFPANLQSGVSMAKLKMLANDMPGAEKQLKELTQRAPQSQEAWVALGNFYSVNKRFPEANQAFQSALKLNPRYGMALASLGEAQYDAGQKDQAEATFRHLSSLPDSQYEAVYGGYLMQAGKKDAAIQEFQRLMQLHPKDRAARTQLLRAYVQAGRTKEAQALSDEALKKNPKDSDALLARAGLSVVRHDYASAQNDLAQVLQFDPRNAEVHYLLAQIYRTRGFALSARQELSKALDSNPDLLQARLALAADLSTQSPQQALDLLDKTPKTSQKLTLGFVLQRNTCLLALGRNEEVQKTLDAALKVSRDPQLLVQQALLDLRQQRYDQARAALREALDKNPDNPRALDLLGNSYLAQKQRDKGLEAVRAHAAKYPKLARIQQLLGGWLQGVDQLDQARKAFEAAKAADPGMIQADVALAVIDMRQKKPDAARQRLSSVVSHDPQNVTARLMLALAQEELKNYSAAVGEYRQILTIQPDNIPVLNNLAYDLAEYMNQSDAALASAQKAKELAPKDPRVADTLGWVLYRKGVYRSAVDELEEAVHTKSDLSPEELGRVQYHLAMAYLQAGDTAHGREALSAAQRLAPALPESKQALDLARQARP